MLLQPGRVLISPCGQLVLSTLLRLLSTVAASPRSPTISPEQPVQPVSWYASSLGMIPCHDLVTFIHINLKLAEVETSPRLAARFQSIDGVKDVALCPHQLLNTVGLVRRCTEQQ